MTSTKFIPSADNQIAERIYQMPLAGLLFVAAPKHEDFRGFYAETAILPDVSSVIGTSFQVKQSNLSRSVTHVARGFHAEQWNKLVTVLHGKVFCAWVDVRPSSKTYGDSVTMRLGADEAIFGSVFVSTGIANGYVVEEGPADYFYLTDALYRDRDPSFDVSISLFDDEIGIEWPVPRMEMLLSQRDKQSVSLATLKQNQAHANH